jgi:hypothetical protein
MIRTPSAKDAHATLGDKIRLDAQIEAVVGHASSTSGRHSQQSLFR